MPNVIPDQARNDAGNKLAKAYGCAEPAEAEGGALVPWLRTAWRDHCSFGWNVFGSVRCQRLMAPAPSNGM
jgi:hypothetical protein